MKHLFVPYELALKLKEKGFDEPCFAAWFKYGDKWEVLTPKDSIYGEYYMFTNSSSLFKTKGDGGQFSAPLYQQVIDWFREKYNCYIQIAFPSHAIQIWCNEKWVLLSDFNLPYYDALNKAIEEALKLIP